MTFLTQAEYRLLPSALQSRVDALPTLPGYDWMAGHLRTLYGRASASDAVTELGTYHGVSTTAFLCGLLYNRWQFQKTAGAVRLVCVDRSRTPDVDELLSLADLCGVTMVFHECETTAYPLERADLVLVDAEHTAADAGAELERVKEITDTILLHDTAPRHKGGWGDYGTDGGPGVVVAIGYFLLGNGEWEIGAHHDHCCGLTELWRKE